ncbi:MAG: DNRLRE domain-containing protein, partial [Xanthomonadales bacterium]|nr:DNRLRE domain-containing protein [Xanthomonadales bacterium]NIX12382.1 DNRLRE domain-containing protein [Xanthomonadales bacterium]
MKTRPSNALQLLSLALCSLLCAPLAQAQAGSGAGVLAAEATVFEDSPGANGGGYSDICVGNLGSAGSTRRAYVSFDLPDIPAGATITRVELSLQQVRVRRQGGGKPATLQLRRVTSAWQEGMGGGQRAACGGGSNMAGVDWDGAPTNQEAPSGTANLPG